MDLTASYLGMRLRNPLVASASPLTLDLGNIRRLEDCGAAAIVLPSLFEEQIEQDWTECERLAEGDGRLAASSPSGLARSDHRARPEQFLEVIRKAREAVAIPVIASLNGTTSAGWSHYARFAEQAGASAVELNVFYIPADAWLTGDTVEKRYLGVLRSIKSAVAIPVAMKLSPYLSSPGNMARMLAEAGADGFVLFNRFYLPDIDLETLRLRLDLQLSAPTEIRLPLLWLAVLFGRVRASLAASTGVDTRDEVLKYLLAGADAVMTTSALLRRGLGHIGTLLDGLAEWLGRRGFDSVAEIRGRLSLQGIEDGSALERANYIRILQSWPGYGWYEPGREPLATPGANAPARWTAARTPPA